MERPRDPARLWWSALAVLLLLAAAASAVPTGAGGPAAANGTPGPAGSVSLLVHLPYPPGERDQGQVATCWVWAGTAVLEIAHSVQDGVRDPLSVQFVDSNFNGGAGPSWAGRVGTVADFAAFYREAGVAVPRANRNADYQDAAHAAWCNQHRRAWVDAAAIQTTPHYPITGIAAREVPAGGTREETIARIKAHLDRGRALHLTVRDLLSLGAFQHFWRSSGDETVFEMVEWHGVAAVDGITHQMAVVGYDDTDPENRYWLVLNSWGTANGLHPNGTFRLSMEMDYASRATSWTALDVTFGPLSNATTPVPGDAGVPADADDGPGRGGVEMARLFGRLPWHAAVAR